ncbi:MAG: M3 family metallopeptidase, partial [Candidatus Kapabacteria bacterium]|nr:M3 family metallopeptidase [Candidatus Kapabacteria bacterium]
MKSFSYLIALLMIGFSMNLRAEENPFMKDYNTPFGVPPFDKIKLEHYMPAFKEGIKQHIDEVRAISGNSESPTFENTIIALERSGSLLDKVSSVFYNMMSSNTGKELQEIAQNVTPLLSMHSDDIMLNADLFKRIKTVYDNRKSLNLNPEQSRLLEETYKSFVRSGANLEVNDKDNLRAMNEEISMLTLKFGQNVLSETNEYKLVIENKEDLAGLPQSAIDAAAHAAQDAGLNGKWVFTLHNPSFIPFMTYSAKRDLREKMFNAYSNRGNNDNVNNNNDVITRLVNLRIEKARLLGFRNHAEYVLAENMAKDPENVRRFLEDLWGFAKPFAETEAQELQKIINSEGGDFALAPWDWRYYSEKLREQKYNLNEEEVRPYFKLENVRDGIFELTKRLWGLTYTERKDIPKYHDEVTVYEVKKSDGSHLGILYMDFHP